LQDDCPVFPELSNYVQLVAGASMTAARMLRDGEADVAINWTGGRCVASVPVSVFDLS
jgi:histone deacetylase 8